MELEEYKIMYDLEENYWWYIGLRNLLLKLLKEIKKEENICRVLDAGCGTGGNIKIFNKLGIDNYQAFDFSINAVNYCHQRGYSNVFLGNVNNIPFNDNQFDFILCTDVFECEEVDEQKAYSELLRVLRPGGRIILCVPSYQFLLSEHDLAIHSVRRYNKKSAIKAFMKENISIKIKYFFFFTTPLFIFYRVSKILKKKFLKKRFTAISDLKTLPTLINNILKFIVNIEVKVFSFLSFPFGTTTIVIIQKR
jgi:ubiquinone/menaquinone biosynthesis C-methylase UbiE